jgi:hypothetical protein
MSTSDRGGLKSAFAGFKKPAEDEAERRLLGRAAAVGGGVEEASYQPAVAQLPVRQPETLPTTEPSALIPRPLRHREAVRQLSFRCPVSIAAELRRKAGFNQLEQQEIIVEGIKRVLAELEAPPTGWDPDV